MKLSAFGDKFSADSGIVELMDDLNVALNEDPDALFMGGGNPARIPSVEAVFQQELESVLADDARRHSLLGLYQAPQGDVPFRKTLAEFLNRHHGWCLSEKNISIANGSQSAFFLTFNMLAGKTRDGERRTIHLPVSPEYLGYRDAGISPDTFSSTRPSIERLEQNLFKYRIDFDAVEQQQNVAAYCVSRPTNPTGNVITDGELKRLDALAQQRGVPLIVDGAYGLPFPNILFTEGTPDWNDNTILLLSLSKLGLPAVRTGIVIASEEFSRAFSNANTITSLASTSAGPVLTRELFADDRILEMSRDLIQPHYYSRAQQCLSWFAEGMAELPYRLHKPEGAIFLWLWLEGLPISSHELYERLKARSVLVVPGEPFFIGQEDWGHSHECLRISYAQDEAIVRRGIAIICEEARKAYEHA